MADFFEAAGDGSTWDKISRAGLERIRSRRGPACDLLRVGSTPKRYDSIHECYQWLNLRCCYLSHVWLCSCSGFVSPGPTWRACAGTPGRYTRSAL